MAFSSKIQAHKRDSIEALKKMVERYGSLYRGIVQDVETHSKSKYSIPNVSAKIGKTGITALQAMQAVNEAAYEGQKLSNLYNSYYVIKLNELYFDSLAMIKNMTHLFYLEPDVQEIKTSAEKERQRNTFCHDLDMLHMEIKKYHENLVFLGKYVENVIYSLDRFQKMIDSLDRLASREMWVDIKAQDDAESNIDAMMQEISKQDLDKNKENKSIKKESKDVFDDFDDEGF